MSWYFCRQIGPVSSDQLKQLALSGELNSSDLVWKEGMMQWASANHIRGLFPDAQSATSPPLPPTPIAAKPAIAPNSMPGSPQEQPVVTQPIPATPPNINPTTSGINKLESTAARAVQPQPGMSKAAGIGLAALGGAVVGAVAANALGNDSSRHPRSGDGNIFIVTGGVAGRTTHAGGHSNTENANNDDVMDAVDIEDSNEDEIMDAVAVDAVDSDDEVMDAVETEDSDDDEVMDAVEAEDETSGDEAELGDFEEDDLSDDADEDTDDTDDAYEDQQDDDNYSDASGDDD